MGVRCFLVTASQRSRRYLRRYAGHDGPGAQCPGPHGYHQAWTFIEIVADVIDAAGCRLAAPQDWDRADPRWPIKCESCDYVFAAGDVWQVFQDEIYVDAQGAEYSLREKKPGMMWDAFWMPEEYRGPDGRCLVVVCPDGHEWMIDSQASNCDMKSDRGPFSSSHRCWCRHGEPPNITVNKSGRTCGAGGGSIDTSKGGGSYHGFLKNGVFEP